MDMRTVRLARNGDPDAIELLYRESIGRVHFLCQKMLADRQLALSTAKESFLTAMRNLTQLEDESTFLEWLELIAENLCCKLQKSRQPVLFSDFERQSKVYVEYDFREKEDTGYCYYYMGDHQTQLLLSQMVDRLPDAQRLPLMYRFYLGLEVETIAKRMNCSEAAIKSRLFLGRENLQKQMAEAVKANKLGKVLAMADVFELIKALASGYEAPAALMFRDDFDEQVYTKIYEPEEEVRELSPKKRGSFPYKRLLVPALITVAACAVVAMLIVILKKEPESGEALLLSEPEPSSTIATEEPHTVQPTLTSAVSSQQPQTARPTLTATVTTQQPTEEPTKAPTEEPTAAPTTVPDADTLYGAIAASGLDYVPTDSDWLGGISQLTAAAQERLYIRKGPSLDYDIVESVPFGTRMNSAAAKSNWFLVEYEDGKWGWASGALCFAVWMFEENTNAYLNDLTEPINELDEPYLVVTTAEDGSNMRSAPAATSTKLGTLETGKTLGVLSKRGDWYFVNHWGTFCWMHSDCFDKVSRSMLDDGSYYFWFDEYEQIHEGEGIYWMFVYTCTSITQAEAISLLRGDDAERVVLFGDSRYYKEERVLIAFNADLELVDRKHPELIETEKGATFTAEELSTYKIQHSLTDSSAYSSFPLQSLDAYRELLDKYDYKDAEFFGTMTIKNGLVTEMQAKELP
ncbi:MAG: SH3 domain-containing protein [Clostridia bacterium]|nr:SH3 domain-containing protein [Clostridia bacterium]